MNKLIILLLGTTLLSMPSFAQVSFTGSSSTAATGNNGATIIVDNALVITTASVIDGARVSITNNFHPGDQLGYNNTLLPPGVSGSYSTTKGILTFTGNATAAEYQTLLRSVTFTATASGVGDRSVLFNLGTAIAYNGTNHFYEYISATLSWKNAKANAATKSLYGLTGYLATITSDGENQFIQQKVAADGWIGGSDDYAEINAATGVTTYANQSAAEGKYYWITGPEAGTQYSTGNVNPVAVGSSYTNWNSGEPNNSGGNEHYAQIYIGGSFPGKWNDLPDAGNTTTKCYIIEYGGLSTDPAVDLTHSRTITVMNTAISTTSSNKVYSKNSTVAVDNNITVQSGGLISNARVTISENFTSGDALSFNSGNLPSGVTAGYNASTGVLSFNGTATPAAWQALFRSVTFSSTSPSTSDRSVSFSVGNLISGNNGHFYEFVSATAANWQAAQAAAAGRSYMGLQGYLATITSAAENALIHNKLNADGWIGGSDEYSLINAATGTTTYANQSAAEGNFYWVTGPERGQAISHGNFPGTTIPPGGYANWYNGEPNNYNNNEHFIEMYSSSSQPGTWNDMPFNATLGYVVEYGGLNTDPGIVLSASRTLAIGIVLAENNLKFEATDKGQAIELKWAAKSDNKISLYKIMHSKDGRFFTGIGQEENNTNKTEYSYTDYRKLAGTNYYKLAVVYEDGKIQYSELRTIERKSTIQLFPTLVFNQFTVVTPFEGHTQIIIRNADGALVEKRWSQLSRSIFRVEHLKPGAYFIQVLYQNKEEHLFKILKQ